MYNISRHISYLLLNCRQVVVPKLGTFFACYERATFDYEDRVFYPSKIRINFIQEQDGEFLMLENSLKRKFKISESEARKLIEEFVSQVLNKIELTHYCRLDGIGYLIKANNGKLHLQDSFWKDNDLSALIPMII